MKGMPFEQFLMQCEVAAEMQAELEAQLLGEGWEKIGSDAFYWDEKTKGPAPVTSTQVKVGSNDE